MLDSVKSSALSPATTGLLLFALTLGPSALREKLGKYLSDAALNRAVRVLKALFALGLASRVNARLNEWALHNYRWKRSSTEVWNWRKEVAVLTGGSSGIGALLTKKLAYKGITVVVLDVNPLPKELTGYANIKFHQCDISDHHAVNDVADTIRTAYGSPSILINNAGIVQPSTILNKSPESLRRVFDVNLLSHYYTLQAFVPAMIERKKGHIMGTVSLAAFLGVPGLSDYCATKAGLLTVYEALRAEVRRMAPEVQVSTVHPMYADTPLIKDYKHRLQKANALIITPEEVADAMAKQIFTGNGSQICLPERLGRLASLLRAVPHWMQEKARGREGGDPKSAFT